MDRPPSDLTLYTADVHDRLRAMLDRDFGLVHPLALGTALAYELASNIATTVETSADALELCDYLNRVMKDQLLAFGVGQRHP